MWESCSVETRERAERFAERNRLTFVARLGYGVHGIVLLAAGQDRAGRSAVKVHERREGFERERDCYLRLRQRGVNQVLGHHVPELITHDDELMAIELTVVTRPYVLDFGGAYIDKPPDYPEDVLAEWQKEKEEQFESRWLDVEAILSELQWIGIHVADVNPGNITFADE